MDGESWQIKIKYCGVLQCAVRTLRVILPSRFYSFTDESLFCLYLYSQQLLYEQPAVAAYFKIKGLKYLLLPYRVSL